MSHSFQIPSPSLSRAPLSGSPAFALEYEPETHELIMLDQRLLPGEVLHHRLDTPEAVARAIQEMVVRGAPAIGIAAAYAMAQLARTERGDAASFLEAAERTGRSLDATRPTAVNLAWAIRRMRGRAVEIASLDADSRYEQMLTEAEAIHREDVAACREIGRIGAEELPAKATVLTHCNAGALATGGYGTALGVIRAAVEMGKEIRVLADETRPYLQGARLTAWELHADGITDNMAGHFMQRGQVDWVVVGSDRIARNGDVANKIGTYGLAVLARAHQIPFTVAAPWSTVDLETESGAEIPIEERSREEVARVGERLLVADGIPCPHPAFDITPARLVDAIYTERGRISPSRGEVPGDLLSPP
ncbi:MAG: S-methyl-5-thioribose-1-phosphate isomerase [Myxococcales bacterium]|nr:S-methyl-5-thioribose-1-phosphate isomerase [Myxococcales bacterium]